MAFTVQDNNGSVANANAYISLAEFQEYHADRGNSLAAYNDAAQQAAIIRATDYLDQRFRFVGEKRQGRLQTTQWPREDVDDVDGYTVTGIPPEVKEATAEYALRALTAALAPDPTRDASGVPILSKSESVGPVSESTTFAAGAVFRMPRYPDADQKLVKAGLVCAGGISLRG